MLSSVGLHEMALMIVVRGRMNLPITKR